MNIKNKTVKIRDYRGNIIGERLVLDKFKGYGRTFLVHVRLRVADGLIFTASEEVTGWCTHNRATMSEVISDVKATLRECGRVKFYESLNRAFEAQGRLEHTIDLKPWKGVK